MNRRVTSVLHETFRDNHGVFVVVTVPHHVGHEYVLTKSEFAFANRWAISEALAFFHFLTERHNRVLINTSGMVGAFEFSKVIGIDLTVFTSEDDMTTINFGDFTIFVSEHHVARVASCFTFDTSTHKWSFWADNWDSLTLHVGTHERASRIIVFKERNTSSSDTHNLVGGNINIFELTGVSNTWFAIHASWHFITEEVTFFVELHSCCSSDNFFFFKGVQVNDFVGHARFHSNARNFFFSQFCCYFFGDNTASFSASHIIKQYFAFSEFWIVLNDTQHFAVWSFNKTKLVNASVTGKMVHQTDVRTFWCSNRTNTAVMGRMYVAHFKASAITTQTTRTERVQTTLMFEFSEWVGLIHELTELRAHEKFADSGSDRTSVDKFVWC